MTEEIGLIMFWGRECPHCHVMMKSVERLEKEENVRFERLEVWHNEENAKKMRSLAKIIRPACGGELGTPIFYDPSGGTALCGEKPYEELKEWALNCLKNARNE
jgi:thiol-disulfide isomerase/thioredoxin